MWAAMLPALQLEPAAAVAPCMAHPAAEADLFAVQAARISAVQEACISGVHLAPLALAADAVVPAPQQEEPEAEADLAPPQANASATQQADAARTRATRRSCFMTDLPEG
jgi:hypothetical protein